MNSLTQVCVCHTVTLSHILTLSHCYTITCTGFDELVDMVSISTLFAFWIVALALMWNRYYLEGVSPRAANLKVAAHLAVLVAASLGESQWGC